jgi:hypothetical protein
VLNIVCKKKKTIRKEVLSVPENWLNCLARLFLRLRKTSRAEASMTRMEKVPMKETSHVSRRRPGASSR